MCFGFEIFPKLPDRYDLAPTDRNEAVSFLLQISDEGIHIIQRDEFYKLDIRERTVMQGSH